MKKILSVLIFIFAIVSISKTQTIVTVNQYNVPYSIYGDSIKNDTASVIADFRFNQKFDLVTQMYAISTDTIGADIDVSRSIVNIADSYVSYWSDTLSTTTPAVAKDTANYSKFLKFTINGSDTCVFNIILKALEPIE